MLTLLKTGDKLAAVGPYLIWAAIVCVVAIVLIKLLDYITKPPPPWKD